MRKPRVTKKVINAAKKNLENGLSEVLNLPQDPNFMGTDIFGLQFQSIGTQLNQVDTLFKNNRWYLVSNMRQLLSQIYVEHGLIQTVVDVPVDDAFRGGISIKTSQLDDEDIAKVLAYMDQESDFQHLAQSCKWDRLFGGGGAIIITDQDPATEFDPKTLTEDSKLEFRDVDMWELFWSKQNTSDYSAVIDGPDLRDVEFYDYYGHKVHQSRVMKLKGIRAPSFIRPRLRGWGVSVVETLVNSINQYLKTNNLIFSVLDEFKIDAYKIKNLASTLLTAQGQAAVQRRLQIANQQKNFQNALIMDSEDDFIQKELSFAGIAETMNGIRMQIASDLRMPLTKVFGISAQGFSSGQEDMENYNAMVESSVRHKIKPYLIKAIQLRCQQLFGVIPDDLTIEFKPLRVLTSEQEQNVKNAQHQRLMATVQSGLMTVEEFKNACNKDNLLNIQIDTSIDKLEVVGEEAVNEKEKEKAAPKSTITAKTAKNEQIIDNVVSLVAIIRGNEVLTGQRKDCNKWVFPGGSIEGGESIEACAIREVYEEAGIRIEAADLNALSSKIVNNEFTGQVNEIHCFVVHLKNIEMPKTNCDPDDEVRIWRWVPISTETHELRPENRYHKNDVLLEHIWTEKK